MIKDVIDQGKAAFREREDDLRFLVTAILAGEHTMLIGPPGTAKSAMTRQVAGAFGLSYGEFLMGAGMSPDDVLGPPSLPELRANNRLVRAINGYAPSKQVVFFDEAFKSNDVVLNSLLALLNERVYHDEGQAKPVPLVAAILASNELPSSDRIAAFADRILVRRVVDYVTDDAMQDLFFAGAPKITATVDPSEILATKTAARGAFSAATEDIKAALAKTRRAMREAGHIVSDRRWQQIAKLLAFWTAVDARTEIAPDDLFDVIPSCSWRDPKEIPSIVKVVSETCGSDAGLVQEVLDAAKEVIDAPLPKGTGEAAAAMAKKKAQLHEQKTRLEKIGSPRAKKAIEFIKTSEVGLNNALRKAIGMS